MAEANGSNNPNEGEDSFNEDPRSPDGKKKKFKPFQKMKNFFRGSSKKRFKTEEGPKFHSTSALNGEVPPDEDDDDGGFRKSFTGSRSISEDSIFKPDLQKEVAPIGVLHGQAVSMEGINQAFKSELYNKLRARQSDSDIDEGLPYSPAPTLTSSNPAFYSQSVPAPGSQAAPARDSEQSLISVDGNSDDDLFTTNWKSGVASVKTGRSSSAGSLTDVTSDMDFESVQGTMYLSNEAAKHRISVKPKSRRLSSKVSMRSREKPNTKKLPEVQEETSPSKTAISEPKVEAKSAAVAASAPPGPSNVSHKTVLSTTIPVSNPGFNRTSVVMLSDPKEIPQATKSQEDSETVRPRPMSPLSTSPMSASMLQEVKLRPRPTSGKFDSVDVNKEPPQEPKNELAKAFTRAKRISRKFEESGTFVDSAAVKPVSVEVNKDAESKKPDVNTKNINTALASQEKKVVTDLPDVSSKSEPSNAPMGVATSPEVSTNTGVSFVLKKEPLKPASKEIEKPKLSTIEAKDFPIVQMKETPQLDKKSSNVVVTSSAEQKSPTAEKVEIVPPAEAAPENQSPVKQKFGSPEKLASPREEYRLKRAARSKTLPVSKEMVDKAEGPEIAKQQKTVLEKRAGSPPLESKIREDYENVVINARPIQPKRASWAPSGGASSQTLAEPIWVTKSRIRKTEEDKKAKELKNDNNKKEIIKEDIQTSNQPAVASVTAAAAKNETAIEAKLPEKSTVVNDGKPVRSWAQTHSAKPFEKTASQSSVKPVSALSSSMKTSFDKPSVPTAKPTLSAGTTPVPASNSLSSKTPSSVRPAFDSSKLNQGSPAKTNVFERSFSQKSSSVTMKPSTTASTISTKPPPITTIPSVAKPALDSNKPSISPIKLHGSVNKSVKQDSNSTDVKNAVTPDNKKMEVERKKESSVNLSPAKQVLSNKPETTTSSVPAWKQNLRKNNTSLVAPSVNIEIIDKDTDKKEPEKKVSEKSNVREKTPSTPERCADTRPSKVSDMIKNFQKLQAT